MSEDTAKEVVDELPGWKEKDKEPTPCCASCKLGDKCPGVTSAIKPNGKFKRFAKFEAGEDLTRLQSRGKQVSFVRAF